jgi:hypothetical protein
VAFGIRSLAKQMLEAAYDSPQAKENLAKALQDTFNNVSPEVQKMIMDAFRQISARAPQAVQGGIGGLTPKSNPPKIVAPSSSTLQQNSLKPKSQVQSPTGTR